MQKRIVSRQKLLSKNGYVTNPGYATDLLWEYSRADIKASKLRVKEWDYYLIYNNRYAFSATIADLGYVAFSSAYILDFANSSHITTSIITPFSLGKLHMPTSYKSGDVLFKNQRAEFFFSIDNQNRYIEVTFDNFFRNEHLTGSLCLHQNTDAESIVIAAPSNKNKKCFHLTQKFNCIPTSGLIMLGAKTYFFDEKNTFGTIFRERGVWTYFNKWYWGSGSGKIGDDLFGFNIGYGLTDTSSATENTLFFNNKVHKIEKIYFNIPKNYMKPWHFTSSDNRFEMEFVPILDRSDHSNIIIAKSHQHQVFGKYSGTAVLDDGRKIHVKDFLGFAEKTISRW